MASLKGLKLLTYLEDNFGNELWVGLLARQEFSYHFVHNVLGWEKVSQEGRQNSSYHSRFIGVTFLDSVRNNV